MTDPGDRLSGFRRRNHQCTTQSSSARGARALPPQCFWRGAGFKILLVDKATFPSDTLSTLHPVAPGPRAAERWGLARLSGCHQRTSDLPAHDLLCWAHRVARTIPDANDGNGGYRPRRILLDTLLLRAAAESGAEVREAFTVDELLVQDDVVVGIRGHSKNGAPVDERARITIGADWRLLFGRPRSACAAGRESTGLSVWVLTRISAVSFRTTSSCIFATISRSARADQRWPASADVQLASARLSEDPLQRCRGLTCGARWKRTGPAGASSRWPSRRTLVRHSRLARIFPQTVRQRMGTAWRCQLQPRSDHGTRH